MPGLRVGYSYSTNKEINSFVRANLPIWNMNSIAEHFLEIVLKHRNTIQKSFLRTINDRDVFAEALAKCEMVNKVLKSGGNFITAKLHLNREEFKALQSDLLSEHKIYIKDVSSKFKSGTFMRLAVRKDYENINIINIFKKLKIKNTV